ncbi:fasciclin domain-containing protein [Brevundimonas lenta]|uniref:Putative surface protein with fasciclin (FAS1) repeats n=1 Tax=Brevundimonas lenta TaxID=424796 RepID=A0A7W6JEY5_9CAUL|nr:fasciclin domain-containing protein [Brevundimonas lenta]MBB4083816.1 putative surface protein with fasciclin (FAS1) repeats [Brevundimonas lenta]
MLRIRLLTAVAATALAAGASAFAQTPPTTTPTPSEAPSAAVQAATPATADTVIDVLQAQGNFTTLLAALDQAQLTETLRTRPAVSIFAPTDAAFAALPEADRTRLMDPANAQELRSLLLYHVIVADVSAGQIQGARGGVETAARTQVLLDGTGEAIKVDAATVTQADLDASNGAVFAIDKVLNPAQSMAAVGDEEAAAPATPAAAATEAVEGTVDETTDAVDEATEAVTAPITSPALPGTPSVPALPTTPSLPSAPSVPSMPGTSMPSMPSMPSVPTLPTDPGVAGAAAAAAGVTATTRPATGEIAPTGQPAATTTTIQAPPVHNPTDGDVDEAEDPANPAPTPPN